MKTRTWHRNSRPWLSLAAILLGFLGGYFVGRATILRAVDFRLIEFADQVLAREEQVAAEVTQILAKANASLETPCSEQDILELRRLTFAARYLKDVGRLQGDDFLCSATTGKLIAPELLSKPDLVLPSGGFLYRSYPLRIPAGVHAEILALRNADVVVSPDIYSEFPQEPIRYAAGVPEPVIEPGNGAAGSGQTALAGVAGITSLPAGVLDSSRGLRAGDRLYRARCSKGCSLCAVASIGMPAVWTMHRTLLLTYTATGGLAGVCCATALMVAGRKRRSHTNQLKRAILRERLTVAYQPIVELGSHRIVGAEALARWVDEDGESVKPETILALAEAERFVSEITRFVLTRAVKDIRPILEWDPGFRLSINLAPTDLADPRLLLLLDEQLRDGSVEPANIAFELPERATSERSAAIAGIRRLRERGHATFLDDFGSGYSNLAYLTELKVDGIKINRSFIATIGTESVTATIVPQILAVAEALGLSVVVQGIEREDQARYFAGVDPHMLGQGWFFGLPVSAKGLLYLCAEKSE